MNLKHTLDGISAVKFNESHNELEAARRQSIPYSNLHKIVSSSFVTYKFFPIVLFFFLKFDPDDKNNFPFPDSKDITLVLLLCAILMNKQYIKTVKQDKYRPSIAEIQNSIIMFANVSIQNVRYFKHFYYLLFCF